VESAATQHFKILMLTHDNALLRNTNSINQNDTGISLQKLSSPLLKVLFSCTQSWLI